jgi:tetratricopeptide (TPR) repeat protein
MTSIKVYLHLEGQEVSYTLTQYVGEDTTVQDLLRSFAEGLRGSFGSTYTTSTLTLKNEEGKVLNGSRKSLYDMLSAGDDLFVFSTQQQAVDTAVATATQQTLQVATKSEESDDVGDNEDENDFSPSAADSNDGDSSPSKSSKAKAKAKARARAKAKAAAAAVTAASEAPKASAITVEQKAIMQTLIKEKSYKKARELAEHILANIDDKCIFTLRSLAHVLVESKHHARAIEVCKRGLKECPRSLELHYLLAKCQFATKQFSPARAAVTTALALHTKPKELVNEPERMKTEDFKFELIALQAECVFELGQHNEAVAIINSVTANTASANNVPILLAYSHFAMQYNKLEEPTRALLKAVIMGENRRVRALLAKLISSEAGIAEILRQVPPSTTPNGPDRRGKCEVYAFLGYVAKCHSAVPGSIRFYQLALQMLPSSTSCALNLAHMHEINADYDAAMRVVEAFCRDNATVGLGCSGAPISPANKQASGFAKLTCGEFLEVLNHHSPISSSSRAQRQLDFHWVQLDETYGYVEFTVPLTAAPGCEEGLPVVSTTKSSLNGVKYLYSEAELDLLALFATAVKILYLQGKLHLLPGLYRVLEPCRMQTQKPLHETTIRNEMAYFQQVAQLMCFRNAHASYGLREAVPSSSSAHNVLCDFSAVFAPAPSAAGNRGSPARVVDLPPLFREAASRPIYVLGDSHVVCQSWSIVTVQGKPRLLLPRLSTGIKQWHLRPDSDFYPKYHFQRMVASIPQGSEVCVCLSAYILCRCGFVETSAESEFQLNYKLCAPFLVWQ